MGVLRDHGPSCAHHDCAAPERLATFWGALLGRPIVARMGPYVWLKRENGLGVGFQKSGEPKAGKNRVHFDS
ncbi:VOC family protein [Streptosporangium amethystogenes]|uniref:VOC family protein n=1 Tax=Streptosporangium amethystogenes TaxID=2002 RepID=UPI0014707D1E|nr:VOC family protein [Streptosporangium amethystogenes]